MEEHLKPVSSTLSEVLAYAAAIVLGVGKVPAALACKVPQASLIAAGWAPKQSQVPHSTDDVLGACMAWVGNNELHEMHSREILHSLQRLSQPGVLEPNIHEKQIDKDVATFLFVR